MEKYIMNLEREIIFDFKGNYELVKCPPKEDGYYMTIRCGLGGIYTHLDEWKDNHWQVGITDASTVIAYSRDQIPKEEINEWLRNKLEDYKKKK